jgi:hypothetical protein
LEHTDRLLPAVKPSEMFAALAILCFDDSTEVEYSVAGHPAILHYRADRRDTARPSMNLFPWA